VGERFIMFGRIIVPSFTAVVPNLFRSFTPLIPEICSCIPSQYTEVINMKLYIQIQNEDFIKSDGTFSLSQTIPH
jgi:hypothetical protein